MSTPVTTTLAAIRARSPCAEGWAKLLAHLGKTTADVKPLALETVLDSNGVDDAVWCLRALGPKHAGWIRHFAVDCAEDVRHLMTDPRSLAALGVARRYAAGQATDDELVAAEAAAREAAGAAGAAGAAVWAAEWAVRAANKSAAEAAALAAGAAGAAGAAVWAAEWAARAAAGWAARAAIRQGQTTRLRAYLRAGCRP